MAPSQSNAALAQPQPTLAAQSEKCVLLVDDETAYIDLLEQLLGEHLACPVYSFTKAPEALRALPNLDIGLIVTDYQMPELDGLQFIAEAQRHKPDVPVIMITAYQTNFTPQQLSRVPSLKVVVRKPFKWTTLASHISQYWNGSRPPFPFSGE